MSLKRHYSGGGKGEVRRWGHPPQAALCRGAAFGEAKYGILKFERSYTPNLAYCSHTTLMASL